MAGLLAALVALYLCTAPDRGSGGLASRLFHHLPILVFATFGCYFTILKYLQTYYLNPSNYHAYVMSGFVFAFISSIVIGVGKRVFATADFRIGYILGYRSGLHQLRCCLRAAKSAGVERLGKLAALSDL
jgi:hypothetical protein